MRIATSLKKALEMKKYAVDIVFDGENGKSSAVDPDYDLVILDRRLPGGIDGLEICREVRAQNISTPILILTAKGEIDDKVEGLQSGADDYLVKPFSVRELIARVEVLLRRPKQSLGTKLVVSDLELDPSNYIVSRAGRKIKLSSAEYKLLTFLMYNKEQTLSKDKIISHVWDADTVIVSNTVEVYIGYLRKKIDKAFPDRPELIHTIRGFGYRISEKV